MKILISQHFNVGQCILFIVILNVNLTANQRRSRTEILWGGSNLLMFSKI